MRNEGSPIARCPNSRVVRAAELIAKDLAGFLVNAGEDPNSVLPFVRRGIETAEEVAEIVLPDRCVNQVLSCVLSVQDIIVPGQNELLRK